MLVILSIALVIVTAVGLWRGYKLQELWKMGFTGLITAKNIAIVMLLVGALTGLWRACGTIPTIVSLTAGALQPAIFLPTAFLLNSAISVLTGTSIGTAATMGVICMSVGNAIGIDPAYSGGAILSGAYFGDRCSPVSTSALLVAEITRTDIYRNIRAMIKTCVFPTLIALAVYACLGINENSLIPQNTHIDSIFEKYFKMNWITTLPAFSILALAIFKINVRITMLVSIAISVIICICIQKLDFVQVFNSAFWGFEAPNEIAGMMSGGGIFSMIKMIIIVLISLICAGLLKGMNLLQAIERWAQTVAQKTSPFTSVVATAIATCAVSCNQTLSIVMTNEICRKIVPDNHHRALYLENSSVVIAPLIPWTVASLIPIGTINAPTSCILFAFLLYLIPVENLFRKKSMDVTTEIRF